MAELDEQINTGEGACNDKTPEFSVLMSVYKNSRADEFRECMDSLLAQTASASQYVLVIDGPIPDDLAALIEEYERSLPGFETVPIANNVGLGIALSKGMEHCRCELIARMDTDDIADATRFEKELDVFAANPDLSIVGCNIAEFEGNKDNITSHRLVAETHEEICKMLKKRCPFNHMTVMFKKSEVERAGGYQDLRFDEDGYLWVRMYLAGCKFYNIQQTLVFARVNINTFKRRGGYDYYKQEKRLFKYMRDNGIITGFEYFKANTIRFIAYVLMPARLRAWAFKKFMRN